MTERLYKLLLHAREIPPGATVTKRTGEKKYVLRDQIKVYRAQGDVQEIRALDGTRFLVGPSGDIDVVGSETELVWHASLWEVREFFNPDEDE